MSSRLDATRNKLISACATSAIALDTGASRAIRESAVKTMIKALKRLVDNDDLTTELFQLSALTPALVHQDVDEVCNAVAELMTEQHALLLVTTGYKNPPPPPAFRLVEQTRLAALRYRSQGLNGPESVDIMLTAVREYIDTLEKHLKRATPPGIRFIARVRSVAVVSILLTVIANAEYKIGDSFDVEPVFSLKEKVKLEVTIPAEWGETLVKSIAVSSVCDAITNAIHGWEEALPYVVGGDGIDEEVVRPPHKPKELGSGGDQPDFNPANADHDRLAAYLKRSPQYHWPDA